MFADELALAMTVEGSPETLADELAEQALAMLADELALAMTVVQELTGIA